MNVLTRIVMFVPLCALAGVVSADASFRSRSAHASQGVEASLGWIVDRADNICGLDDPKMLSQPARVDYELLLRATPEMKKVRDDKIDPNSSEGIQLRQAAVDRVRRACERVRTTAGYCSVWKEIRHGDGRIVADVTEQVRREL